MVCLGDILRTAIQGQEAERLNPEMAEWLPDRRRWGYWVKKVKGLRSTN